MPTASELLWSPWTWTLVAALVLLGLERLRPALPKKPLSLVRLATDVGHMIFFALFGAAVLSLLQRYVDAPLTEWMRRHGHMALRVHLQVLRDLPVWGQALALLVANDLLEYVVHRLHHRVPLLWRFHQVHHSVKTGEMYALVSSRFHGVEIITFRSLLFLPSLIFAVRPEAFFAWSIVSTVLGLFTHANLDVGRRPLAYVLNTPRMHHWHHARLPDGRPTVNFGFRFAVWDWLFRTAYLPDESPTALGFDGDEAMPSHLVGHQLWPLWQTWPKPKPLDS